MDEFNFTIEHVKGKINNVTDALSRIEINNINQENLEEDNRSDLAITYSAEEENTKCIRFSELPINVYNTQIIIKKGTTSSTEKLRSEM